MNYILRILLIIFFTINLATSVQSNPSDKLYQKLDLFSDVLNTLSKEYVDEIEQDKVIDSAINGMLQSLDPYSSYMSPEAFKNMNRDTKGEFGGLGIEITMEAGLVKIITPIEGTPADRAGVQAGDYIVKINNKQVKGMSLLDAVKLMRGKVGTSIDITIRRPEVDEEIRFKIKRAIIKIREVSAEVKNNIGYIRLRAFNQQSHSQLIKKINTISNKNITGYILDLRNNPGGLLSQAIKITETFLDGGEIVSTKGRDKNDIKIFNAKKGDSINNKPLIILINQGSASASEIVSGALKDHKRAILLGEKTFGKGSVQSIIPLKNKGGLRLTTAKYYLPSGISIHEKGVEPDITVKRNKDNFKINTKTDNQLNYAIKLLKKS
ncbi:MAG: peptidase S41 [Candidatus Pelagibacter sp.]|nr:peptidase S41 [Candidatus Pelagibacter sp.]OUV86675.1 MAG: peptidase S41 [Pelagibacteraceae bacterium TMED136]|tara:strand:- start:2895 stop:4034 length:1140 start_codon:yes stop_codon:yes gene_type:complete